MYNFFFSDTPYLDHLRATEEGFYDYGFVENSDYNTALLAESTTGTHGSRASPTRSTAPSHEVTDTAVSQGKQGDTQSSRTFFG